MFKKFLRFISVLALLGICIFLGVDYFYSRNAGVDFLKRDDYSSNITSPFSWDFDSEGDFAELANEAEDYYFRNGNAYIYFKKVTHFVPHFDGSTLNLRDNLSLRFSFYSNLPTALKLLILKKRSGGMDSFETDYIPVKEGWNELTLDLTELSYENLAADDHPRFDWDKEGYTIDGLRFFFTNSFPQANYLILDNLRLEKIGKIVLNSENISTWGGQYILEEEKSLLIATLPLGIGREARRVSVSILPLIARPGLQLYYHRCDDPRDRLEDVDDPKWRLVAYGDRYCRIPDDSGGLLQLKVTYPLVSGSSRNNISEIIISYNTSDRLQRHYPPFGFVTAKEADFSALKDGVPVPYSILPLDDSPERFFQVHYLKSIGTSIIGVIEEGLDASYLERLLKIYEGIVSIWAVKCEEGKFEEENKRIAGINPSVVVIPLDNSSSDYLRNRSRQLIKQRIEALTPDYVSLDRGPVFFVSLLLVCFLCFFGLQRKLRLSFMFKKKHLKIFSMGLISSALLVPLVFILGLGSINYVTFGVIISAFYRYLFSALVQEIFRAIAIEYMAKHIISESKKLSHRYFIALVITSVFFSLVHLGYPGLEFGRMAAFMLLTLFAGLIFGWVYIKSKSIMPPFLLHLVANIYLFAFTTI